MSLPLTPSFRLDGRRALITGAGRGIGLAVAAALAEAGAEVTLAARSQDEIESAAAAIRARGQQATALRMDVAAVEAAVALVERHGPFDILVNNAGISRHKFALDADIASFDEVVNVNIRAAYFLAQAVARGLVAAGKPGSIINISSQMGIVGGPKRSVYCATKFAMEGFTRAMAIEFGPHRIRVNTIAPTFIMTPMVQPFFEEQAFSDWVLSKIKLGRVGQVEDLMGPVVFLASDASALMTGSTVLVDGGWTAE
jgi:NAD(P)-dependent dehydrogenase (short-subunit alcohol dehydrogenase family)